MTRAKFCFGRFGREIKKRRRNEKANTPEEEGSCPNELRDPTQVGGL